MRTVVGTDLVELNRFTEILAKEGERFLSRIFHPSERQRSNPEHLAGISAAKEAVLKALDIDKDRWLDIEITHLPSGKPMIKLSNPLTTNIASSDLSISHDGNYVTATVVLVLNE